MFRKVLLRRWLRVLTFALLTSILCCEVRSHADSGPQLPCGSGALTSYPDLENSPVVRAWEDPNLGRSWAPPHCIGWASPGFSTLVVTVARFRYSGGGEGLRRRVGAISELTGMLYWSTSKKQWQPLIVDASALQGAAGDRRRDFSLDEVAESRNLYFQQKDSLLGNAVYRIRIRSVSPERLVFDTENTSTIRYLLLPLFGPSEVQSIYFLERESRDVWRYYNLARTSASSSTQGYQASFINRAVAFYRHLVGIPTDKEPPASR
jgi:hypothetical protein